MNPTMRMNGKPVEIPKFSLKHVIVLVVIVLAVIGAFSCWFTIGPEEVGVVLRFGKLNRTTPSGLHLKFPFGIEKIYKVARERQYKEEFGFRTITPGKRTVYSDKSFLEESLQLTGDLNAAQVEWIVQFRIVDPYKFLFKIDEPIDTFRDINESVVREIVGDRTINEVLTVGREEIAQNAMILMQQVADKYETGIKVIQVVLQTVNPPEQVKPSFNQVNQAQQEREKLINQARSEYNKIIPKAKGEAIQVVEQAEGYRLQRVNEAEGDAARFTAVFDAYMQAPEVTRRRMYLETMNDILQNVEKKVITETEIMGMLPLFNLTEKGGDKK